MKNLGGEKGRPGNWSNQRHGAKAAEKSSGQPSAQQNLLPGTSRATA